MTTRLDASTKPGTTALVTGASGGLGAAIARRLAARGVEVWLAARREAALREEVQRIERSGGRAHALVLDIGDADAAIARLRRLDEETGGIDLVVANAAIAGLAAATPIERVSWDEARDLFQVNLVGNVATLMAFIPRMVERGRGHLVAISSLAVCSPSPRFAAYGAGKAGLSYFLEAAGIGLRPLGVYTTVVEPGFMRTPAAEGVKEPMPFIVGADEAARIIDRAVQRRTRRLRFPRILAAIQQAPYLLPGWASDPIVRYASRER